MDDSLYKELVRQFEKKFNERPNILFDINFVLNEVFGKEHNKYAILDWTSFNNIFCNAFEIKIEYIKRKNRSEDVVILRHFYCYLLKHIFGLRYYLVDIGKYLGRDHSTIFYSVKNFQNLLDSNNKTALNLLKKWDNYYFSLE